MIVFFTDLDGTLLDHDTYSWEPARLALDTLKSLGHAVVLCTSKAKAEVAELRQSMSIRDPYIVENGGAVIVPPGYFGQGLSERIELGTPYLILVEALGRAAIESGVAVRGFAQMTPGEIAQRTGLPLEVARLSHQREYDEPFEVESGDPGKLCEAIEAMGFSWTRGGRFFHIVRNCDKAKAVATLAGLFRTHRAVTKTVGLGDGLNDVGFLREVDSAWLIPSKQTAELLALVPGAKVASSPGPVGWSEAVTAEWEE
ncbi:MAG: HAD hydrolase family protein [Acidobacteriota bacterium]